MNLGPISSIGSPTVGSIISGPKIGERLLLYSYTGSSKGSGSNIFIGFISIDAGAKRVGISASGLNWNSGTIF